MTIYDSYEYKRLNNHTVIQKNRKIDGIGGSGYTSSSLQKTFNFLSQQVSITTIARYNDKSVAVAQNTFNFSDFDSDAEIMEAYKALKVQGGKPEIADEPPSNRFKPSRKKAAPSKLGNG